LDGRGTGTLTLLSHRRSGQEAFGHFAEVTAVEIDLMNVLIRSGGDFLNSRDQS
jgi:hypothetical protein